MNLKEFQEQTEFKKFSIDTISKIISEQRNYSSYTSNEEELKDLQVFFKKEKKEELVKIFFEIYSNGIENKEHKTNIYNKSISFVDKISSNDYSIIQGSKMGISFSNTFESDIMELYKEKVNVPKPKKESLLSKAKSLFK